MKDNIRILINPFIEVMKKENPYKTGFFFYKGVESCTL
ncbi:hypothetical protein CHCC15543_4536 [Bacillus licheniformis]|nr:hypothetical protein CHCC15543_4536 [Bacillus licheniformis]